MKTISDSDVEEGLARYDRTFFDPAQRFKYIGTGSLGGKARGLAHAQEILAALPRDAFPGIEISIPSLTVLRTSVFDTFMSKNDLHEIAFSDASDGAIARAFQKGDLPVDLVGDLRALVEQVTTPLAVRSSSLLEDALHEPFAGIYETKMIPNNQPSADERFRRLAEAIKLVFASTYFRAAKSYVAATRHSIEDEKMAVIIQEVVGRRFDRRYYPNLSGVARSHNYYAMGRSKPEDGVVSLALGLGMTIVDGDPCWTYSPAYPANPPPFSAEDMMKQTQSRFWAVNMGKPPAWDPTQPAEYLVHEGLPEAEFDGSLANIASTFDPRSGRISPGTGVQGPRVLDFSMILVHRAKPLNELVRSLLQKCEDAIDAPVEIEFAMSFDPDRFGFLQVRPMAVSREEVLVREDELSAPGVLAAARSSLGNGTVDAIRDVVYVRPEAFDMKNTPRIAREVEQMNRRLVVEGRPYLLIGFGRWGSSDPWLGIPVDWGQISGARVIVESMREGMSIELSQGSHFFHNLTSFEVKYLSIPAGARQPIDWEWLGAQRAVSETDSVRHVHLDNPLSIRVDGRTGRGVIQKGETS
jgi:hypothetical protein